MSDTDLQLLARYTRDHADDAFTEIVHRHLNLVHSAALRQVRSPQLAEEVAQSVFIDLARNAGKLANAPGGTPVLTAWLYQVTRRTAIDVVRREARRQLREQIATEMNTINAAPDWLHIEPLLDDAMAALEETDRTAILLRYFENKSLREVGTSLGTSDDAAQKRLSRAVERLREFLTKRGVSVSTGGLVLVISANAVQAAPVGLAIAITSAAMLASKAFSSAPATAFATKAIFMTTLQKTIVTATIVVAIGMAIYEAREAAKLRREIQRTQLIQMDQSSLIEQIEQLHRNQNSATQRLSDLSDELARAKRDNLELLRLRGEIGVLRRRTNELNSQLVDFVETAQKKPLGVKWLNTPATQTILTRAISSYAKKNNNQLPATFEQLKECFPTDVPTFFIEADSFKFLINRPVNQDAPTPHDSASAKLLFRERWPHPKALGFGNRGIVLCKLYGFTDGSVAEISTDWLQKTANTQDFSVWEQQHLVPMQNQ